MTKTFWIGFFLLIILLVPLSAAERIHSFHAEIQVGQKGELEIKETIRVQAEGNKIQRGIYRDIPTVYRNSYGFRTQPPLEILGVERNGKREDWHTESVNNSLRIYFGNAERRLLPGEHTYTLHYRTGRQIFHLEDHDELYWNVTGNYWEFPIQKASVEIQLPPGARVNALRAYTGPDGSTEQDWKSDSQSTRSTKLETTVPLPPGSGFTVVANWNKGVVIEPSPQEVRSEFIQTNLVFFIGAILVCCGGFFLFVMWVLIGKDPPRGIVIPLYEPPEGFDPASARFLSQNGKFDDRSFAAAVLHLAVDGFLKIIKPGEKTFSLVRTEKSLDSAPPAEAAMAKALFGSKQSLTLSQTNHQEIGAGKNALKNGIEKPLLGEYFIWNRGIWVIGILIMASGLALAATQSAEPAGAGFMLIWLLFWSVGTGALLRSVVTTWATGNRVAAFGTAIFSIPFVGGWFLGLFFLTQVASPVLVALGILAATCAALFFYIMRAPTHEGRKVIDAIEGLKLYLSVGEQDRLNLENPPGETPAQFERFLPYALALGVEQAWSERFASQLEAAQWEPAWGSGPGTNWRNPALGIPAFTSGFSSTLGASSISPKSSSSGGGGSSGGGRGGGGGGGW